MFQTTAHKFSISPITLLLPPTPFLCSSSKAGLAPFSKLARSSNLSPPQTFPIHKPFTSLYQVYQVSARVMHPRSPGSVPS